MKASGPAYIFKPAESAVQQTPFARAYDLVHSELTSQAQQNPIFAAHLELLEDPMLREGVDAGVADGLTEPEALQQTCEGICAIFSEIEDEYLRSRADDVRDICCRLRRAMCPTSDNLDIPDGSILVAEELLPSDTARLDFSRIRGIICHKGSATSHVCIIAHSKGVPINVGADISCISEGDVVSVDDPLAGCAAVKDAVRAAGAGLMVNAGSIDDVQAAMAAGADGIGLLRTEFLFLGRDELPAVEEQCAIYTKAAELCVGRTLIIRTLDVGGDKPLGCIPAVEEPNPMLGVRGIRHSLAHPDILRTQIDAIVRAAGQQPDTCIKIMIPMVTSLEEVRTVRSLLRDAGGRDIPLGIMVETPAAALLAADFARECDFFSVGSNDLTQYIMAADRGNPAVLPLYGSKSPAVLRALELTVAAAKAAGIPVGICGELASDPAATQVLLNIGFDYLSVSRI